MQRRKRNNFQGLNMTPAKLGATAWWRPGSGITEASGAVVAWTDVIGAKSLVQSTPNQRPVLQSDGSLVFDGSNDYLISSAFTLNQPFTVYLYAQQISWTANDIIFDGFTYQSAMLAQGGVDPQVFSFAGAIGPVSGDWISGVRLGLPICCVFDGANSSISVGYPTISTTTGNVGAQNAGGFTLGAGGGGSFNHSNIRVWEVIINNGADSTTRQHQFLEYLNRRHQV